ncbi:MAG: hypothetical protein PHC46_01080 [Clostridia bacterium]|nr:hypothetical protein [Clostridia bacterium]
MFKKSFGFGSLIFVFLITVVVIMVGGYFAFSAYISPYLNDANLQEVYTIYNALSEDINEAELVTNEPTAQDYDNAETKLTDGGINIFNEYGDIDPALIEESNFLPAASITLTDKELASVINEFIENPLNLEKLGINLEDIGGLNTKVLEVNIETTDSVTVALSFIVRLDMQFIKERLAFFGYFLPSKLYIKSQSTLQFFEGEYTLINGNISVNNIDEELNERMLEILVGALRGDNEDFTVQDLHEATGKTILAGIQETSNTFNTSIIFNDGTITFVPNEVI